MTSKRIRNVDERLPSLMQDLSVNRKRERETETETERDRETETERQRQRETQTQRQTDRDILSHLVFVCLYKDQMK